MSKCNPLCGEGERCTEEGECEPDPGDDDSVSEAAPDPAPLSRLAPAPAAPAASAGARPQSKLYLRLGVGGALMLGVAAATNRYGDVETTLMPGFGAGLEASVGASLGKGVVLGGLVQPMVMGRVDAFDVRGGTITFVGPFVNYYPAPAAGFHLQGGAGYVTSTFRDKEKGDLGVIAGLGQEWRTTDQASIGFLGRLT